MVQNKLLPGFFCLMLSYSAVAAPNSCKPITLFPLADFDISARNMADIPTQQAFKGKQILFSLEAKPLHKKNRLFINPQNGLIKITADGQDRFTVTVKAQNPCGFTKLTFNVHIFAEE